ncbi:MAG: methyltransferase domain-containing protein [Magnetovibrionaceae bacterium]
MAPLLEGPVEARQGDHVLEGALIGSHPDLPMEYPVLNGLPVLMCDVGTYLTDNQVALMAPLFGDAAWGAVAQGRFGDALGPGTAFDQIRQNLSTYAWEGYGAHDPAEEASTDPQRLEPGSLKALIDRGFDLLGEVRGPGLDLGSAVGAGTFHLAERLDGPVVGLDASIAMSRLAASILRTGEVRYPRRRVGLVYDERRFSFRSPARERVDFWLGDALNAPFADGTFGTIQALNILDCVQDPAGLLLEIERLLMPGGKALIASPYDWSPGATPTAAWIGGHSQRGQDRGATEPLLARLLGGQHPRAATGLKIIGQVNDQPWNARMHDRSVVCYTTQVIAVQKAG